MKPHPEIRTADLVRDYENGLSTLALSRRYGFSRTAIHYRLKRAGVTLRHSGAPYGNQNARKR